MSGSTTFPGAVDTFSVKKVVDLEAALVAVEKQLVGPAVYNVRGFGAVGDGTTNDTAAILAAITAAPAGSVIYFPEGTYRTDAIVVNKMLHLRGDGRYSSWLVPNSASTTGLVQFSVPSPSGSVRASYGPSFVGLGIDLRAYGTTVGLYVGVTTGWFVATDVYMQGGAVHVRNIGTNSRFERMRLVDAGTFFKIDGTTGMEVTLKDIDATRASSGTTTWGIEIIGTLSSGNGGDIRMDNVVVNSAASGGAVLAGGMLMQYPGDVSIPVFANDLVIDNCAGPALKLDHVRDTRWNESWFNSAAGSTCAVQITAGGNHQFAHSTFFGGGGGGGGTYEFLGTTPTTIFRSEANTCHTGPVYRFSGTGGWTDAVTDDIVPGASVLAQVTNDAAKYDAGQAKRWGKWAWQQPQVIPPEDVSIIGITGPAFENSWAAATGTIVFFWKGPAGVVYLSGLITGGSTGTTAFTLPAGWRPFGTEFFETHGGDVEITAAGLVKLTGSTVAVSGITFRAAN